MVALEAWFNIEDDDPTIVRTPAELDAVLDELANWVGRNIVELFIADDPVRAILDVGVNAKSSQGTLYYSGGEYQDGCFPRGATTSAREPLQYHYMGSNRECPSDAEISLAAVRRAAHEYMATGGNRPTSVDWQPAP